MEITRYNVQTFWTGTQPLTLVLVASVTLVSVIFGCCVRGDEEKIVPGNAYDKCDRDYTEVT